MPKSEVIFNVSDGGLGIIAENADNVSALIFDVATPTAYGTDKMRSFTQLSDIEALGIIKGHATYGVVWYHCSEYFRMARGAKLWLAFNINFPDDILSVTSGEVRQAGVFTSDLTQVGSFYQGAANVAKSKYAPLSIVVGYRTNGAVNINNLPDCAAMKARDCSVLICGSGSGEGLAIAQALGVNYEPSVGTVLGAMAKAKVSESIGHRESMRIDNTVENATIRLCDGTSNPSESVLDQLDTKRYLTFAKHYNYAGTFVEKPHTATLATSDFSNIQNNRTIGKAMRGVRLSLLPKLQSPIKLTAEGKLAADKVQYFENLAGQTLRQMQINEEISDYRVLVSPDQNILSTGELRIKIGIIPMGWAKAIVVDIGFTNPTNFQ